MIHGKPDDRRKLAPRRYRARLAHSRCPIVVVATGLLVLAGTGGAQAPGAPQALPGARVERLDGAAVPLVIDGTPVATLVLEPGPDREVASADRHAAELLQEWIERITGARLPIGRSPATGTAVLVGEAATAAGLRLDDVDSPSHEAVRVVARGDRVLVSGQTGESRLRAAALLLELLGCRWYMEGELGKECPEAPSLSVPALQASEAPGLRFRRIWSGGGWGRPTDWKAWNGDGGEQYEARHDWNLITEADYDAHPDWFRMDEHGNRVRGAWLNTGNLELREAFARRLIDSMVDGEHRSISPPDGYEMDYSPESLRYDDPEAIEPSSGRVSMSNRFLDFAGEIARRVAAERPHSMLGFYAYSDYSLPPTRIDHLEPNLCIWIAPIRFSRFHRIGSQRVASSRRLEQVIEGWSRVASCLGYRGYGYSLAEAFTPFSKVSAWRHDLPWLADLGLVGLNLESFPVWDLSLPSVYLSIRLAYHPHADAVALLDDLMTRFYGPAAAAMRAYWREIDNAWSSLETESGSIYSLHEVWTPARLARLDGLLRAASAAVAGDDTRSARVAIARTGLRHARDFMRVRAALQRGDPVTARQVYEDMLARTHAAAEAGTGHVYSENYLRRFLGSIVEAAYAAVRPEDGPAARVTAVLPDRMRLAYERDLPAAVQRDGPERPSLDDSGWPLVQTYGATLDQQGLPDRLEVMWYRTEIESPELEPGQQRLFFTQVDGDATVFVNGRRTSWEVPDEAGGAPTRIVTFPARTPFQVDATSALMAGRNRVAVRVDHRALTELALGGIVGPVYLIETDASGTDQDR